jgi:hypothetical protein
MSDTNNPIETLKYVLRITRTELQEEYYDNKQSKLCQSLRLIEMGLEDTLKYLGSRDYKRAALKTVRKIKGKK